MSTTRSITSTENFIQLAYGADFIKQIGIALKMSHSSITFAQNLLHRFYYQVEVSKVCCVWACGSCILIACKINNIPQGQSIHNISNVAHYHLCTRERSSTNKILNYYGVEGYEWKKNIIQVEKYILFHLGFQLSSNSDITIHSYILIFVYALMEHCDNTALFKDNDILQHAWNFANDCMLMNNVCAMEKLESVACSCIELAFKKRTISNVPTGWQVVFGSSQTECERICSEINRSYELLNHCELNGSFTDYSEDPTFKEFHPTNRTTQISRLNQYHEKLFPSQRPQVECKADNETVTNESAREDRHRSYDDVRGKTNAQTSRKRRRFADA